MFKGLFALCQSQSGGLVQGGGYSDRRPFAATSGNLHLQIMPIVQKGRMAGRRAYFAELAVQVSQQLPVA